MGNEGHVRGSLTILAEWNGDDALVDAGARRQQRQRRFSFFIVEVPASINAIFFAIVI